MPNNCTRLSSATFFCLGDTCVSKACILAISIPKLGRVQACDPNPANVSPDKYRRFHRTLARHRWRPRMQDREKPGLQSCTTPQPKGLRLLPKGRLEMNMFKEVRRATSKNEHVRLQIGRRHRQALDLKVKHLLLAPRMMYS